MEGGAFVACLPGARRCASALRFHLFLHHRYFPERPQLPEARRFCDAVRKPTRFMISPNAADFRQIKSRSSSF
jgi:hypothetical protein